MKKFLLKIALFAAIMIVVDFAFGQVCDYLNSHAKTGTTTETQYHIAKTSNEDIIMMGSSRMHHHYVPQIFEDSLGMTCYNAGIDGNGIILAYGYLNLILERYTPKMIIYDVSGFDMYVDNGRPEDNNIKYLDNLKEYFKNDSIQKIFHEIAPQETYKMQSKLYRYNSKAVRILGDYVYAIRNLPNGYSPLYNVMSYEPDIENSKTDPTIDFVKLNYVNRLIDLCSGHHIQLIFAASPKYKTALDNKHNDPIKNICKQRGIDFIDLNYCESISNKKAYFQDLSHLNDIGAKRFCSIFIEHLQHLQKTSFFYEN